MAAAASSSSASAALPPTVLTQQRFAQAEQRARSAVTARATKPTPELHILGELCGATGFGEGVTVACKWALEAGDKWEWQEGAVGGQTQADCGEPGSDAVVWAHPLDVHFSAGALQVRWGWGRGRAARGAGVWHARAPRSRTLLHALHTRTRTHTHAHSRTRAQGWPKLLLQVWRLDDTGRLEVEGYGFVHVPSAPGLHEVSVPTWRPLGTPEQELAAFFLGGVPRLKTTTVLFSSAHDQRFKHVTASAGTVHLRLEILLRHFDKHEIEAM